MTVTHKLNSARDLRNWYFDNGVYRDPNTKRIGNTLHHIERVDTLLDENIDGWDILFNDLKQFTSLNIDSDHLIELVNAYDPTKEGNDNA